MSLTHDTVNNVAHLARLEIAEDRINDVMRDLDNILQLVEKMNQVDTTNIEPLAHPIDICQPLREDRVIETNQRDLFQSIAPQTQEGLYIVPQVIESE